MVTENSTSGSGSPDISISPPARDDRRKVVSRSTVVVAILAECKAGIQFDKFWLMVATNGCTQENRYFYASGSLASALDIDTEATILIRRFVKNVEGCTSYSAIVVVQDVAVSGYNGTKDGGCTSDFCYSEKNVVFYVGRADTRYVRNVEGCTSYEISTVWISGDTHVDRNVRIAEGCTSLRQEGHDDTENHNLSSRSDKGEDGTTITPGVWCILLVLQSVGYHYVVCIQVVGYILAKICFMSFGTNHADVGSELGWQIVRGVSWSVLTFSCLVATQRAKKKRLQVIQQRRHSLCVRPTSRCHYKGIIWACLILNTHAIAAAQGFDLATHDRHTVYETPQEPTAMDIDYTDSDANASSGIAVCSRDRRYGGRQSMDCHEERRLLVYGHHSVFGACGPRQTTVRLLPESEVERIACEVWQDHHGAITCHAKRTHPQPNGLHLTMLALLDHRAQHGPVVLTDVELQGGVPRRHTVRLDEHDDTGQIIQRLDRDRRCYPHGNALCVLRHASRVYFDFERYTPTAFDYVSLSEIDLFVDDIDEGILTLWQQIAVPGKGVRPPVFAPIKTRLDDEPDPDICDLDEYIYPYPFVQDENDILDMPPRHLWLSQLHDLTLLQNMNAQFPARVTLDTYGLHDEYVGNRVGQILNIELSNMIRVVSQLWAEFAVGSHMHIYRANPQPEGTPPNTLVLVVEFPLMGRDHTFWKAALLDKKIDGRATDRIAVYIPRDATVATVAETIEHDGSCWPQGLEECHVHAGMTQYSYQDRIRISSGDYIIFTVYTFQSRFGLLGNIFPDSHQFARDFMWRSNHYGRQEFTILIYAVTGHYQRVAPRSVRRTIDDFRHVEELWSDAVQLWATHGANDNSQLQTVWPQTVFRSGPENIHLILNVGPIFPWLPILLSVLAQFGEETPRRIETQAWQVPRQPTVQHLMALTGFSRLAHEHARASYVTYARQEYNGEDTVIDIQRGGHYELHLYFPSISDFVLNLARYFHEIDLEPAEDTTEDEGTREPPGLPQDDAEMHDDDHALLQIGKGIFLMTKLSHASYTDNFLDRTWAVTTQGEQELAMANDIDPEALRLNWLQISTTFGIPRPIDSANYIIYRPPRAEEAFQELVMTVVRFDDPFALPFEIQAYWPDLTTQGWRLFRVDDAVLTARTRDDGWSFVVVVQAQDTIEPLRVGVMEIISRYDDDEHSMIFSTLLPQGTTWAHLWSWLHLGAVFPVDNVFQIYVNDVLQTTAHDLMELDHGYFVQIVGSAVTEESFIMFNGRQIQTWRRSLCLAPASGYGLVFRATVSARDSVVAMLPHHRRDHMILEQWTDLNFWALSNLHASGVCRGPPWMTYGEVQIVQDQPDGTHIATLGTIYDGTGTTDKAIIVRRRHIVFQLLQILECDRRCFAPQQFCVCRHNGVRVNIPDPVDLMEGDYFEVFISSTSRTVQADHIECLEEDPARTDETAVTVTNMTTFTTTVCSDIAEGTVLPLDGTVAPAWLGTESKDPIPLSDTMNVVLLQTSVLKYRWNGDTTRSLDNLNPPGNGRILDVRSGNLDTMDGLYQIGDTQIIYDFCPPQTDRRPLHLTKHLPAKANLPDQSASIEIPDEATYILAALRQGHVRSLPLRPLPEMPWHEATRAALKETTVSAICHGFWHIELYTDGSAGQLYADYTYYDHAAWGFVVIGWDGCSHPTILTLDHGHVTDQPDDPTWTGASRLNAMAGERGALIAAATWLLRSQYQGLATFRFDSVAAGFAAAGQWNTTPGSNDATLLRVLFQLLQTQPNLKVNFEHVKAHTGDPWNECANTLAYQAWTMHTVRPILDVDVRTVLQGERPLCMQWPLLHGIDTGVDIDHGYLSWYRDTSEPRPEVVWRQLPRPQPKTTTMMHIRMATFNVCTLHEQDGGIGLTSLMRAQFAHQQLDIIGLQETRASTTQVIRSADYTRYISAADAGGHGGTEIWITNKGAFAKTIRTKQTVVLHQDPERLIIRLQVGAETICVIAAHAPHSGHGKEQLLHWWNDLTALSNRLVGCHSCVVLIDANAHFSESVPPWVGDCGLERKDNSCAAYLLEFLQQSQLFIPATFGCHQQGQTKTWRHPAYGTLHRCDYILVPLGWEPLSIVSWVDGCLDTGRQGIDHLAALIEVELPLCTGGQRSEWPLVHIDRHALTMADPAEIEQLFQTLPQPGWAVNIHEQAATLVTELQSALQTRFPCKRKPPRADYISAATWELRTQRRTLRRQLFLANSTYAHDLCGRLFYIWKYQVHDDDSRLQWHLQRPVSQQEGLLQRIQLWTLGRHSSNDYYKTAMHASVHWLIKLLRAHHHRSMQNFEV